MPGSGLKIVHMLDSPAFSTLMLLLACGDTCESAVTAVTDDGTMGRLSMSNHVVYNLLWYFCKMRMRIHFHNTI